MHLDCNQCTERDRACGDCVVTLLMSLPQPDLGLDLGEQRALAAMAEAGLVPRLRLQVAVEVGTDIDEAV